MLIIWQMMLSSCTRDLQPNPYTTILKHMLDKDDKKNKNIKPMMKEKTNGK